MDLTRSGTALILSWRRGTCKGKLMKPDSLLGVWMGIVHNTNGWDMKITLSILQPFEIGSTLGIFDIPMIPCSGMFRVISIHEETIELQADRLQGECLEASSDSLEVLPDGTLLYVSKGDEWETRGVLQRVS
jgi:hypothetical protein